MVVYFDFFTELPAQNYSAHHFSAHNSPVQELLANNYFVPIPPAYQQHPSFLPQKSSEFQPRISDESSHFINMGTEGPISIKERIKALFRFLIFNSKEYARVIAIVVMIVSLILMLIPLIIWQKVQKKPNNIDEFPPITIKPCVVFASVVTLNFAISVILLAFSLMSSKFRKSISFMNAVFAIIAAVGFGSAMGVCLYLSGGVPNKNDLWKWSCDNYRKGHESQALNFRFMCKTLTLAWNFGLLQSTLEFYTLLVSAIAFILIKYQHFAKYGRVGKIF
ncbi:hypothetical protein OnM2_081003 [Erysiphe neolycopersici]|uniref:Uncharacterized protein n=1 Tax=Erysiphe neolycopersici TaxID=212602 RepID=A0A420HG75_9PEZI|nr:hypothetical protein OnM2_081003 [Erysiphe neolycopersici]